MKDRVAMPRVETRWEKAALLLPKKTRVTRLNWARPTNHEVVWDHSSSGGVGRGSDGAIR